MKNTQFPVLKITRTDFKVSNFINMKYKTDQKLETDSCM